MSQSAFLGNARQTVKKSPRNTNWKLKTLQYCCSLPNGARVGLGISDKKIIPRKTELTEQMVISDGIPAIPRNRNSRNSGPNPSAEEKTSRNSVPRNSNRSKLSEFPSEPFSGRENNSEFRSEQFRRRKTTQNKTQQRQSPTLLKLKVLVETVRIGFHHPC
jgi:hypothetical protein